MKQTEIPYFHHYQFLHIFHYSIYWYFFNNVISLGPRSRSLLRSPNVEGAPPKQHNDHWSCYIQGTAASSAKCYHILQPFMVALLCPLLCRTESRAHTEHRQQQTAERPRCSLRELTTTRVKSRNGREAIFPPIFSTVFTTTECLLIIVVNNNSDECAL